jgi:hypothetical protein
MPSGHSIQVRLSLCFTRLRLIPTVAVAAIADPVASTSTVVGPTTGTSKAEGKRKATEDDDEATATEDETPAQGKAAKKRKTFPK